jgi:hypothetical protein
LLWAQLALLLRQVLAELLQGLGPEALADAYLQRQAKAPSKSDKMAP